MNGISRRRVLTAGATVGALGALSACSGGLGGLGGLDSGGESPSHPSGTAQARPLKLIGDGPTAARARGGHRFGAGRA